MNIFMNMVMMMIKMVVMIMAALIIFGVDDFKVIDKNGIKSKKIRTIIQPEHFDGHGQDNDGGDNVVDDVVKCLIKMVL